MRGERVAIYERQARKAYVEQGEDLRWGSGERGGSEDSRGGEGGEAEVAGGEKGGERGCDCWREIGPGGAERRGNILRVLEVVRCSKK